MLDQHDERVLSPNLRTYRTSWKWIAFIVTMVILALVAGYFLDWFKAPLDLTSPARLQQMSEQANSKWESLKAQKATIELTQTQIAAFETAYGTDRSVWPQGKATEELQLQGVLINKISAYNTMCAEYNALWQDEWKAISAPGDLPTSCELIR